MKKAGYEVFKFIKDNFKKKQSLIILCGPGNNGGDGFVIARHLMNQGYPVKVYIYVNKNHYKGNALKALNEFKGELKKIYSRNSTAHVCSDTVSYTHLTLPTKA